MRISRIENPIANFPDRMEKKIIYKCGQTANVEISRMAYEKTQELKKIDLELASIGVDEQFFQEMRCMPVDCVDRDEFTKHVENGDARIKELTTTAATLKAQQEEFRGNKGFIDAQTKLAENNLIRAKIELQGYLAKISPIDAYAFRLQLNGLLDRRIAVLKALREEDLRRL